MHFTTSFAGLVTVAASLRAASALGINCRGSALCNRAGWANSSPESIIQILRDAVWASDKDSSTLYNSGDHIICVGANQPVTIDGGAESNGVSGSFSLSGSIPEGGICLFPQGAALTLDQIRPLTDAVLKHGCGNCGSVPIHFVDQGSNDPGAGILTFNYVESPYCVGNCISATGGTPPASRVRRGTRSYAAKAINP
ncbi:hypothetical protein MMC22_006578 [Lobaria immixta]|nr:hypothetical protein [Lobaria immixta]